jgi:hypothetical protein
MRFMILVRATPLSESGAMPTEQMLAEQLAFHQTIDEAGVLIDAMGFRPTSDAWRVLQRTDGSREVIEGPFLEDQLIAGYTLIDVASREEAMDWSLRYAKTALEGEDGEIEVRQLFDLDEFVQGPAVHGFRELDLVGRIAADVGRSRPDLSRAVSPDGTVTVCSPTSRDRRSSPRRSAMPSGSACSAPTTRSSGIRSSPIRASR